LEARSNLLQRQSRFSLPTRFYDFVAHEFADFPFQLGLELLKSGGLTRKDDFAAE
jgi:hypothetical protein